MEKFWNLDANKEEQNLPELDEEKLKIKDKALYRELNELASQRSKDDFKPIQGSNKYVENYEKVFGAVDDVGKTSQQARTKWTFYDLEDTDISEKEMVRNAFDFLDQLSKKAEKRGDFQVEKEMDLEYKPKFVRDQDKMKDISEKKDTSKPKIKNTLLSFAEEL